jgi:two-component system LytT family response regulator
MFPKVNSLDYQEFIYTNRNKDAVLIKDIVMLEGYGNYTFVHLINGKKILLSKTLKDFCEAFEKHDFSRIRKSYLINLNYLEGFALKGDVQVTMKTGQKIEISRRRKTEFQRQVQSFIQKI